MPPITNTQNSHNFTYDKTILMIYR